MRRIVFVSAIIILLLGGCRKSKTDCISAQMAVDGVSKYCHSEFDWSVAQDNPSLMYVALSDSSETEYKVVFRSYTGAFTYFYVDKASGSTRMVEFVPALNIESEAGSINLRDYLK
ncbi:MAG: hypothetical protein IKO33_08740 [Bacteroidaceae bacterium]|nr:hypothetical protein [Bacteroidaceae bacterium]